MPADSAGLVVVMGVAGSGKSRVGGALARALDVAFIDGDDHHASESVARMTAGIPLTDADRASWLQRLAARLADARDGGTGVVLACSALRRAYRDILRAATAPVPVRFVYLRGSRELIAARLAARRGHFMPASLLDSQLAILEEPAADEGAIVHDIHAAPEEIVAALLERLAP